MGRKKTNFTEHLWLPDFQVKPGVDLRQIEWVAKYAAEKQPDHIIFAGDWADMHSLSSYDKGKKSFEGRRYTNDIKVYQRSVHRFFETFNKRVESVNSSYWPSFTFLTGNHESRITRATELQPELDGLISVEHDIWAPLEEWGVECYPLEEIVFIDGIAYCHYFRNPKALTKPIMGGSIDNRLAKLGHSFTMGHQQTLQFGIDPRMSGLPAIYGLVAGACYLHDEEYQGPQGNDHWRGIVYKHEVRDGMYDPMFVSLDYLRRTYG